MPFRLGERPRIRHEDARDEPAVDPKSERIVNSNISVIIPSYNAEHYIGEALDSVLGQTRQAAEIIVVDDASADRTIEIARSCSPKVRVIANSTNAGPGARRNQGGRAAIGDSLAFLDADDRWETTHLADMAGLLDHHPEAGFAFCRVRMIGGKTGIWPESTLCSNEPRFLLTDLLRANRVHCSSALVRRTAFEEVGGFDESAVFHRGRRVQAEDYDFFLRLSRKWKAIASETPSADYRWHPGQSSAVSTPQVVLAYEYRLKLLDQMRREGALEADLAMAADRVRMCWEENLDGFWSRREMTGVRLMVGLSLKRHAFLSSTFPYILKALCPDPVARRLGRGRS